MAEAATAKLQKNQNMRGLKGWDTYKSREYYLAC